VLGVEKVFGFILFFKNEDLWRVDMIKCPKCGFSQPEDIYCASCGIKMDSYAKKHSTSGLASNWMVHVCLLVIVIISFVLYDKVKSRNSRTQVISTKTLPSTSSNSVARNRSQRQEDLNTQARLQKSATAPSNSIAAQKSEDISSEMENVASPAIESSPTATKTRAEKQNGGLQVSFYRITKQGLGELQKISQALNIAGESSGGLVGKWRIPQLITSGDLQYISGNRYKDFDEKHPTMVFKGQRHSEAARNMGLYFQITSLRKNEGSHLMEVRGWGALKANEPDENYFTGEMTLSPKMAAFVTGFLPKKSSYTEDEKQLFESDRVLKTLNQEDFIDGSTDLIMVIEFSKSN
jgi:hypothetical protein